MLVYQRVSQTRWMTLSQQYDWGKLCKYDTPFAKMAPLGSQWLWDSQVWPTVYGIWMDFWFFTTAWFQLSIRIASALLSMSLKPIAIRSGLQVLAELWHSSSHTFGCSTSRFGEPTIQDLRVFWGQWSQYWSTLPMKTKTWGIVLKQNEFSKQMSFNIPNATKW